MHPGKDCLQLPLQSHLEDPGQQQGALFGSQLPLQLLLHQAHRRLLNGSAVDRHLNQGGVHLGVPFVLPDLPHQVPVLFQLQVWPLYLFGKGSVQVEHAVEEHALLSVPGIGKYGQGGLRLQGGGYLQTEPPALSPEVVEDGRHVRLGAQRAHGVSRHEPAQDPHGRVGGQVVFPLHKGGEHRVLQLVSPRLPLPPQLGQALCHGAGADFVIGGQIPLPAPGLLARCHHHVQHRVPVRDIGFRCPLPDFLVESGKGHAAGVAVQGVRRLHGVGHQVHALVFFGTLAGLAFCPRRFLFPCQQRPKPRRVEAPRDRQHRAPCPCQLPGVLPDPLRHMRLPGQASVLLHGFPGRVLPGQPAVHQQIVEPAFAFIPHTVQFEILLPEFVEAAQPRPLTELPQIVVAGQQIVVVVIALLLFLLPQALPLPGGRQDVAVRQVDESRPDPQPFSRPECRQLRRIVQKGVIAFIALLVLRNPA